MDKYFYLVSQLPLLFFNEKPILSTGAFLLETKKWLPEKDFAILCSATLRNPKQTVNSPDIIIDYKDFDQMLVVDLVKWRESKQTGQRFEPLSFPISTVTEGDPLEVEIKLLRVRWDFLVGMEADHHFNLECLVIYFLKLQVVEKIMIFNDEVGRENFQILCEMTA